MIAINAKNAHAAIYAVLKSIRDDKEPGKYTSKVPTKNEIGKLYDDFIDYHHVIDEFVGADVGNAGVSPCPTPPWIETPQSPKALFVFQDAIAPGESRHLPHEEASHGKF